MGAQTRPPILLTWEDIDAAAVDLPADQQGLLREIVAARRIPADRASIAGGSWHPGRFGLPVGRSRTPGCEPS